MKKYISVFLIILASFFIFILSGCDDKSGYKFTSCVFEKTKDRIILSNDTDSCKLIICVYGNPLEAGEYQVLTDFDYTLLEGKFYKGDEVRDVKSILFVDYKENVIKINGSAQLYASDNVTKTNEMLDFSYQGKLTRQ